MATLGTSGRKCEAPTDVKSCRLPLTRMSTPGKLKTSRKERGKKTSRRRKDNRILVHFKFTRGNICMLDTGSVRAMGMPFKGDGVSPVPAPAVSSSTAAKEEASKAAASGQQARASSPTAPSGAPRQRKRSKKKSKNRGESQRSPLEVALQRVKNHVQTIKREELLLSAYQSNGWNGASRNVVKPTAELQRARAQIERSQHKIRECVAVCDEAEGDAAMPEAAFDAEGDPIVDAIACSRCGGLASEKEGNDIVLCDGLCRRAYHQLCLVPPITSEDLERETWLCPACDCKNEILALLNDYFETFYSLATKADELFRKPGNGECSLGHGPEAAAEPSVACAPSEGSSLPSGGDSGSGDDGEAPIGAMLAGELASEDDDEDEDFSPEEDSTAGPEADAHKGDESPSTSSLSTDEDSEDMQDGNLEHAEADSVHCQNLAGGDDCGQSPPGGKRSREDWESLPAARSKRRCKSVNYVKLDQALGRGGVLGEEEYDDDGEAEEYVPKEEGTDGDDTDWDGGESSG